MPNDLSHGAQVSRRYFDWLVRAYRRDLKERVIPAIMDNEKRQVEILRKKREQHDKGASNDQ